MNQNIEFMKTKLFALLRTFMLVALVPMMSIGLVACEPESNEDGNEGAENDDVTSEVAVTGLVDAYGCKYADISGYANLNLLPVASGTPVVGVELVRADGANENDTLRVTTTTMVGNIFTVSFAYLSPGTEYKYRSYVSYGGQVYYGKKFGTLTTKEAPKGAVDLGLSVLWASCNVGAESPEELGGRYAWGETEEKHEYSWASYKWCDGSENSITKYCTTGNYGNVDNKTVLEPADDVASVKWGDAWRIPTIDEQNELIKECTWEWTSYNDVKGYNVTGPNGNSIFLPATGYCYDSIVMNKDSYGYYWLNSLGEFDSNGAYLFFVSSKYEVWLRYGYRRCYGYPVRAVSAVE